ncbi:MAG TPA: ATP-binding protein [Flavisolibacter sp.]
MYHLAIEPIYLLLFGMCGMIILFAAFIYAFTTNQRKQLQHQKDITLLRESQQNQLIEAAVRSEEIERHRIAETLHDEVGAILSSTKLHLQGIKPSSLTEKDLRLYERSKELLDEGIQKVRGISHNLHSNILKEFGLNEAIRHFVKKVVQSDMMKATTELDDQYVTQNPENDISIYRMVQEIINNVLKHAQASRIHISSVYSAGLLTLTVFHDGNGLSQNQFEKLRYNKDGLGLKNIQNRVILLRGNINFEAGADNNQITISIPLQTSVI